MEGFGTPADIWTRGVETRCIASLPMGQRQYCSFCPELGVHFGRNQVHDMAIDAASGRVGPLRGLGK